MTFRLLERDRPGAPSLRQGEFVPISNTGLLSRPRMTVADVAGPGERRPRPVSGRGLEGGHSPGLGVLAGSLQEKHLKK